VNDQTHIDPGALIREITRYLGAVDVFRAERCEPTWLPELAPAGGAGAFPTARTRDARISRRHRA
jgi:hypothetical protein